MGDQLNYLNNLNRPNLVDFTLLQKINDGYSYNPQPKTSYLYSFIQSAGSYTCSIAKENIFISVIIISLFLFLGWCYIEKQRLDALTEKYLQKKLAKSLLNDELNLFSEIPSPLNIEKLFNDINTDIYVEKKSNINNEEHLQNIETMDQQNLNQDRPVHMTKRELNLKTNEANQMINPIQMGLNQYPSQGFPKGASRDFGQEFNQLSPPLVQHQFNVPQQEQPQQFQQPQQAQHFQQQQQPPPQQPAYQQALSQDGLVKPEQNNPQPIGGPGGSSRYMDISGGFNKNSYMLM
jgi:hypothetical protein